LRDPPTTWAVTVETAKADVETLKALVDQMPDPVLDEKDKDEKIEAGD